MTSEPGKQIIAIYIWPNISRGKGNATVKFDQLIEYDLKNIFFGKIITKYGGTTNPRKSKLGLSLDINRLRFYAVCFIVCLSRRLSKYIEKKVLTTCFYLDKAFSKNKKWSVTSLHAWFFAWFFKILFLALYSVNWPIFIAWLALCSTISLL